jgi:hypothetical protein
MVKRVSVTLDDDLEAAVEDYVSTQEARPSLTAVVQTALRHFLIYKGIVGNTFGLHLGKLSGRYAQETRDSLDLKLARGGRTRALDRYLPIASSAQVALHRQPRARGASPVTISHCSAWPFREALRWNQLDRQRRRLKRLEMKLSPLIQFARRRTISMHAIDYSPNQPQLAVEAAA